MQDLGRHCQCSARLRFSAFLPGQRTARTQHLGATNGDAARALNLLSPFEQSWDTNMNDTVKALCERTREIANVHHAEQVLEWDMQCYMPPGAASARAQQIGTISR